MTIVPKDLVSSFVFVALSIICSRHILAICAPIQRRFDKPAWLHMRGGLGPVFPCRLGYPRSMVCVLQDVGNRKSNMSPKWFDFPAKYTSTGRAKAERIWHLRILRQYRGCSMKTNDIFVTVCVALISIFIHIFSHISQGSVSSYLQFSFGTTGTAKLYLPMRHPDYTKQLRYFRSKAGVRRHGKIVDSLYFFKLSRARWRFLWRIFSRGQTPGPEAATTGNTDNYPTTLPNTSTHFFHLPSPSGIDYLSPALTRILFPRLRPCCVLPHKL